MEIAIAIVVTAVLTSLATMVLYTVRHCVEQPSGRFRIGAQLFGFVGAAEDEPDRVLALLLRHGLARR